MNYCAASSGLLSYFVPSFPCFDTESSPVFWIPAFARNDELAATAGNVPKGFKMVIKCSLSVTPENMGFYMGQSWEVMPLPEYITKMGPHVIEREQADYQVITTYEFDKSKFAEAWEWISEELDAFRIIPEFTLSVSILNKGREVKWYRISLKQSGDNPSFITPSSKSLSSPLMFARG